MNLNKDDDDLAMEAFDEGYQAFRDGFDPDGNTYPEGFLRDYWTRGFLAAELDRERE